MPTESSRGILIAILIICVANLIVSTLQVGLLFRQSSGTVAAQAVDSLPTKFTDAELTRIAYQVTDPYNRHDMDALYEVFDDIFKMQLSKEKLEEQLGSTMELVGKVDSATYSGFKKLSGQDGIELYELNYVVKLSGGHFSIGTMTINIINRPQKVGIVGFFINGRTQ